MKKILPFLFLLCFVSPVLADGFESTRDGKDNRFITTISYSIDMDYLPGGEIEFNQDDIQGQRINVGVGRGVDSFLHENNIHRKGDIDGTFVSLPPEGIVDVLYHFKNDTGHSAEITSIAIAFSKRNIIEREWFEDFAEFELGIPYAGPIDLMYSGVFWERTGILNLYEGFGVVGNGAIGTLLIERIRIKNPLEIVSTNVLREESGIAMEVLIRNNSQEELRDLLFTHGKYSLTLTLQPEEEYLIEYFLDNNQNKGISLKNFRLRNNNVVRKCAVEGVNFNPSYDSRAVSLFSNRSTQNWVSGLMLGPSQDGFCIERIRYTMVSEDLFPEEEEDLEPIDEDPQKEDSSVVENDEEQEETPEDISEVLGVSSENFILPKTGVGNEYVLFGGIILLVVDAFLWYSVCRRKYEKKNLFTKICSKNWKNSHQRRV